MHSRRPPKKRKFALMNETKSSTPLVLARPITRNLSTASCSPPPASLSSSLPSLNSPLTASTSIIFARRSVKPSVTAAQDSRLQPACPTLNSSSSQRDSFTSSKLKQHVSSQHEDLDDLIEDAFSDDDISSNATSIAPWRHEDSSCSRLIPKKKYPPLNAGNVSRPKIVFKDTGNRFERGNFRPGNPCLISSQCSRAVKTETIDPRPWPERFAPELVVDLAVHPKKVSEVRSWLEHVLDGFSKQRVLVLKGPAGTGKTTTINTLSREMGFEVLEWKNPRGAIRGDGYGSAFGAGFTGAFEEFMARAGSFSSLQLVSTSSSSTAKGRAISSDKEEGKKIILIEDFPNAIFASSQAPLISFRNTVKSFLAISSPSRSEPPVPPLVLIISESSIIAGPGAFTAHRLLAPEILNHPLTTSICFNKIAPTIMLKALSAIIVKESRGSNRKFGPSKALMEGLTSSGDVRSAIMGLQFLAVNGDANTFSERTTLAKTTRKKLGGCELNDFEREMLLGITQRESHLGLFHAVGKVVHNKRYGDDVEDPYVPPPPKPLLKTHAWNSRASRVDINGLMDEAGTDAQTLVSGVHENYLGSCNFLGGFSREPHSLENLLDCVNSCLDGLSDSDLLASPRPYHSSQGVETRGNYTEQYGSTGASGIRQDEISFQIGVRGVILALPSPVKRGVKDNKMFYPTLLRLWKEKEEIECMVGVFIEKLRLPNDGYTSGGGVVGAGKSEMVLERLPYLKTILVGKQHKFFGRGSYDMKLFGEASKTGSKLIRELEEITVIQGHRRQGEELPDEESAEALRTPDELELAEERTTGRLHMMAEEKAKFSWERKNLKKDEQWELEAVDIEQLAVLADDDIEDDW